MGWMRANKLKLNPDKTGVLLVGGSSSRVGDLDLVLNGVALPLKDRVHSLGVLLDLELSLEAQVTAVVRSAFLQLWLIHQLHLENDCLATVTHALVTSQLDFCNALYVGLPLKTVRILQMVQNRAARLLTGTGRYSPITPVLHQLHWLPIEVRAQFKVLVITYKALNGLGPGYLKECLLPYLPSHPLRLVAEALLQEPSLKDIRRHIKRFINDTWMDRYGFPLPQETIVLLWSSIVSVYGLGGLLGSVCCGYLTAKYRKKKCQMLTNGIMLTAALSMGFSKRARSFEMIFLGRLLYGIGIGFAFNIHPQYVGEISPKKLRGFTNATVAVFLTLGKVAGQIIGLG
ncbi:Solute carrier family 2, facilitated glucose transporter member 11 [Varanus komodoensis]|nr:Solute carrier family 2, facilitated glucose transporter member 11 [Varanus komodoensis]